MNKSYRLKFYFTLKYLTIYQIYDCYWMACLLTNVRVTGLNNIKNFYFIELFFCNIYLVIEIELFFELDLD